MVPASTPDQPAGEHQPTIIPRDQHTVSRSYIDEPTLKVLYRLRGKGHIAYLVGGGVRDLLLGRQPKDFDVATSATPEEVKDLFRNCFLVGRRFRLAHIRFKGDVVEVATFRRQPRPDEVPENPFDHYGIVENVFGTPAEDAFRRDFTINALFYDIDSFSIIDYTGGMSDLHNRVIRIIGDPEVRFAEDPVRMLRALEFAARLGFEIEEETAAAIPRCAGQIATAAPARIRDEMMELCRHSVSAPVLRRAEELGLLAAMIPGYQGNEVAFRLLEHWDGTVRKGAKPHEHLILTALFIHPFVEACNAQQLETVTDANRLARSLIHDYCQHFRLAKFISHQATELMLAAFRFERGLNRRGVGRFLRHPGTPQLLDFYLDYCAARGEGTELALEWQKALGNPDQPRPGTGSSSGKKRRRPRRRKPRRPESTVPEPG